VYSTTGARSAADDGEAVALPIGDLLGEGTADAIGEELAVGDAVDPAVAVSAGVAGSGTGESLAGDDAHARTTDIDAAKTTARPARLPAIPSTSASGPPVTDLPY